MECNSCCGSLLLLKRSGRKLHFECIECGELHIKDHDEHNSRDRVVEELYQEIGGEG